MRTLTYCQAIDEALVQEMERDPTVFLYGIGVPDHKRLFGSVDRAFKKFGVERVWDTPLSEDAMTGLAIGAAMEGLKPVHIHTRADFLLLAVNQLMNVASTIRYASLGKLHVPLVIRAVIGRGWGQGFQHSKSLHSIYGHVPGLKVVLPTTTRDAKGLLISAIRDPDPVIVLEHRWLYSQVGEVPEEVFASPIGPGQILRSGNDITIAACSWMNVEACQAADFLKRRGVGVEVVDLRTVAPLDDTVLIDSVKKTGRCVVADSDWVYCGFSAEISARVAEKCFEELKTPVRRIGFAPAHCPTVRSLENAFYPNAQNIVKDIEEMLGLKPEPIPEKELYSWEHKFKGPF